MNVFEARNHALREILVAATGQTVGSFAKALKARGFVRWKKEDRVDLVVLGERLDRDSARAFVRAYCPLRAAPGWRVRRFLGRA